MNIAVKLALIKSPKLRFSGIARKIEEIINLFCYSYSLAELHILAEDTYVDCEDNDDI